MVFFFIWHHQVYYFREKHTVSGVFTGGHVVQISTPSLLPTTKTFLFISFFFYNQFPPFFSYSWIEIYPHVGVVVDAATRYLRYDQAGIKKGPGETRSRSTLILGEAHLFKWNIFNARVQNSFQKIVLYVLCYCIKYNIRQLLIYWSIIIFLFVWYKIVQLCTTVKMFGI